MNREKFLHDEWKRWCAFPPAEAGWVDVASYSGQARERVCGRLQGESGRWLLRSGGSELAIGFAADCRWADAVRQPEHEFSPRLLRSGDLLCLKLNDGLASECRLLVPSRGDFRLRSDFSVSRSRDWAEFLASVRCFFSERGFLEATTPTLVPSPGTEPFLEPFSTEWKHGASGKELFLPTSPEFHLKKMLVAGWTRIYEIKSCFRNGEVGLHHQPEFFMLEWYRAYANLDNIAADVENLLMTLTCAVGIDLPGLRRTSMRALFQDAFGFELAPETTREQLSDCARRFNVRIEGDDTWDEIFFRLFLEKIEPGLGHEGPVLVFGYPPSQAALARIGRDGFADRFELYWKGVEIANAFHELNDPEVNRARFENDVARKIELTGAGVPVDEELLQALDYGLPPSGGIALGLDRLFMALYAIGDIAKARAFPFDLRTKGKVLALPLIFWLMSGCVTPRAVEQDAPHGNGPLLAAVHAASHAERPRERTARAHSVERRRIGRLRLEPIKDRVADESRGKSGLDAADRCRVRPQFMSPIACGIQSAAFTIFGISSISTGVS